MNELQTLRDLHEVYLSKARQSREIEITSRAQADAFESDAKEVECAIEAIINRANNHPAPSDVICDAPKGYTS